MKKRGNRKRHRVGILLLCVSLLVSLAGCGKKGDSADSNFYIYYMNSSEDDLELVTYEFAKTDTEKRIDEAFEALEDASSIGEYVSPFINDISVQGYALEDATLTVDFNDAYHTLDVQQDVLVRTCVVETMLQLDGVDGVTFTVNGEPLCDVTGEEVGTMTAESFVVNPSSQFNSVQEVELTLYFSNEAGDGLCAETRNVHFVSSISLAKLVVEQLIEGTSEDGLKSTLSSDTQILSVTQSDGIVYVNLDNGLTVQDYTINESVVIYSIVDSLFALDDVEGVQISVNGSTDVTFRDSISLNQIFVEDTSLIEN